MKILHQLQAYLKRKKIDAVLVTHPDNRRYLSGYSAHDSSIEESSGSLLIFAKADPILLTDFRFLEQAQNDSPEFDIILYKRGLLQALADIFKEYKINRLAYEPYYFLHSSYLRLKKFCDEGHISLVDFSDFLIQRRQQKNLQEIDCIQRSVSLNELVFAEVYSSLRVGMTEVEVAITLEQAMRVHGAERPSFETIVASGPNGALPHAVPTSRKICSGEPVIIDMGLVLKGYCSDMTRTVVLGTPDPKTISIIRLVRNAQLQALSLLKPGVSCNVIDKSARDLITHGGYGPQFGHGVGHGVGLAVHEAPSLNKRNKKLLKPGMVVTIEPGVYISGWGGVRLENMAVITENNHLLLNKDTTFLDL
nr:aminopeptidase P family protein [Desulfobulbaceae bacterium]